jgi:AcrR family transcriptional regulator/catechol 2,3-dioxygenase-like lactoylglutathione lyase family enzyme
MNHDERRQAIVEAALATARRKGLGATTVRDVAAAMGTSSGLIHHYFDSMDDVLAAAFEQAAEAELARASAAVTTQPDPARQLDAFIESYVPAQSDWTMQLWLDAWAEAARRPALQEVSRRLNRAWQAIVREIIEGGISSGIFRSDDVEAAAWRLLSVLDGLALQVVAHAALITRAEVVAWTKAAVAHELAGTPASVDVMARIELVTIVVRDYDEAIRFYVETLGFELVEDVASLTGDGRTKRWVVVRPRNATTGLLLALADGDRQSSAVGNQTGGRVGFFLRVDDFEATYNRMLDAKVEFTERPRHQAYGQVVVFRDSAGNLWDLLGPRS